MRETFRAAFKQFFDVDEPHDFQLDVAEQLLVHGKSVILQAPTGSGKTWTALWPFFYAWQHEQSERFPRQCIYAVPMRVLANQFVAASEQLIKDRFAADNKPDVSIQTGPRAEDRRFESDLIFTTIDQALSSLLTIPYSLGNRVANLNAGAMIGSYLILDEFHLFPVDERGDGALTTTLHMLKLLRGITPFVLMTATFSQSMIKRLCEELDAVSITLSPAKVQAIPSQHGKQRRYRYRPQPLDAATLADDIVQNRRQRTIAICNTVDRAQTLVQMLRQDARLEHVDIELLHSRFYASDRAAKEARILKEFGDDPAEYSNKPMLLVATQVVEVGLNITCQALHSEMAPAAAIVQRAGRCARFANESGEVFVYAAPLNDAGEPDFAPYLEEDQQQICIRTEQALAELPAEGNIMHYHDELALVDAAHTDTDIALLDTFQNRRRELQEAIEAIFRNNDRSAARKLIRHIDNRTLIVHPNPDEVTVPNPYIYEGIGSGRNALLRWFSEVQQIAMDLELDWIARIAFPQESSSSEGPEQRRIETQWLKHPSVNDLAASPFPIALNPALVSYDSQLGLRLTAGDTPAAESPRSHKTTSREDFGPIRRETYAEHIAGLYRVYTQRLRTRTAAARHYFETKLDLPTGTLDRAIRLMFAIHDLGKLDATWQEWAHNWQEQVSRIRSDPSLQIDARYMAAHTDFNASHPKEREAEGRIQPRRPPHAAESARAGLHLIGALAGEGTALQMAMATAIICHHSAALRTNHGSFAPARGAKAAFNEAMQVVKLIEDTELRASGARVAWQGFESADDLSEHIIDLRRNDELLLYLFLVRILRLADQGSQEDGLHERSTRP